MRKAEAKLRRSEQQQREYPSASQASAPPETAETSTPEALPPIEGAPVIEVLLSLLLVNPEFAPEVSRTLDPKWVEGRGGSEVLLHLLDAHANDAFESAEQFMAECDERSRDFIAGLLIERDTTKLFFQAPGRPLSEREKKLAAEFEKELKGTPEEILRGFIGLLERDWKRQRLQFLTLSVKSPELSVEERCKYLMEIEAIRRQFPGLKP